MSIDKNQVVVTPPPEFTDVLKRLAPDFSIEVPDEAEGMDEANGADETEGTA